MPWDTRIYDTAASSSNHATYHFSFRLTEPLQLTISLTTIHVNTLAVSSYADVQLTVDHVVLQRVKGGAAHWTLCLRRSPPIHSTGVSTLTGGPQLRRQMLLEQWRPSKVSFVLGHMTVVISLLVQLVRLPQVCLFQWEVCENIFLMRINKCTFKVQKDNL